jgi:WD40 repeat protein
MAGRRLALLFAGAEFADDDLADLPFVEARIERLAIALERYGYNCRIHVNSSAYEIDQRVREVVAATEPGDVVIVHIVGHVWSQAEGGVLLVGTFGKPASDDLQTWARLDPRADGAHVLFLADLDAGRTTVTSISVSVPQYERASIIGAVTGTKSFRADFSSIAAEVLDDLADRLGPGTEYIPLNVVAGEIRERLARGRSTGSELFTKISDAGMGVDLPFFPNPQFAPPERREPLHDERALSVCRVELEGATSFVAGTTTGVALCDVDGARISFAVTTTVWSVAAIPGMNAVLCGDADGRVTIRSLPALEVQAQLDAHREHVNAVAVTAAGDRVLAASASEDGIVRLWALSPTIKLLHEFTPGNVAVNTIAFTEGPQPLLACGTSNGELTMWDVSAGDVAWRTRQDARIYGLAAGTIGDQQVFVCADEGGSLVMWSPSARGLVNAPTAFEGALSSVALVGDGRSAVVGGSDGRVTVVDLMTGVVRETTELNAGVVWSVAPFESPDGHAVMAATDSGLRVARLGSAVEPSPAPMPRSYAGYVGDVATGEDRLGITGEVDTLCDLLLAREISPPLSIGLFGDWGTGKSFFMGKMRDRINQLSAESRLAVLEGHESALCSQICQIEFNAWHYIDVDLWASLAATIFDHLAEADVSPATREVLGDLPSVQRVRNDLEQRRQQTRDLLEATERELAQTPSVGVREVLTTDTVREVAGPVATKVGEALEKAGVPKERVAELDLRDVADTAGTLWQNLRFVFERTKWHFRVVALLALLLVLIGPLIVGPQLAQWLGGAVQATIASYVLSVTGAIAFGKLYLNRAARAVGAVKDLVSKVDDRRRAPLEARRDALQQNMAEIDQEILGLDSRIQGLHRGNSVSAFAVERREAAHYSRHEGMVATLRRDLQEMSDRLTATKAQGQTADLERIILYIDDLDRCPPRRVVAVLQAIHLLLAFPLFVVVVGVDSRWLLRSLDMFLREANDGEEDPRTASTPQNYLEKIFQISQCLRPMSPDGYSDLISANVGPLEPEHPSESVVTAPAAAADFTATVTPPQRTPGEVSAPPAVRPSRPLVLGREVRGYHDEGRILRLRFNATATQLESVTTTGALTRWSLIGTDPREVRVPLVDGPVTKVRPVLDGHLIVVGKSHAVLVNPATGESREITAANDRVTWAVTDPNSGHSVLNTAESGWYDTDLTAPQMAGSKLSPVVMPLALSRSWKVEWREGTPVVEVSNSANGATITVEVEPNGGLSLAAGIDSSEHWLSVLDRRQELRLHDLRDLDDAKAWSIADVRFAEFGPHGLIATSDGTKVSVWDCATQALRAEVPAEGEITAIAFTPDGGRLATGNADGRIRTWVIHDRKPAVDLSASALRLTEAERTMIIAVRPFIETPRSAKRLINTYRLLRASLGEADLAALREHGHKPVLLLLSVLLGEPEEATELMRELLSDQTLPPTLTALIRRCTTARRATTSRRVAGRRHTAAPEGLEAKVSAVIKAAGTTDDAAEYRRWARHVSRYSFRTLDL